jgi:hypothetical protein
MESLFTLSFCSSIPRYRFRNNPLLVGWATFAFGCSCLQQLMIELVDDIGVLALALECLSCHAHSRACLRA